MTQNEKYLNERYMKFEAEDYLEQLRKENEELNRQIKNERKLNDKLNKQVKKLKKENKHFKSSKAYKVWKKYAKIKDKPKGENKAEAKTAKAKLKNEDEAQDKTAKAKLKNEDKAQDKTRKPKNLKDIKVAFISDQFTYDCFKYEFTPISLHPKTWKEEMKENPDIFLCESTWFGHNFTGKGPWNNKILKLYKKDENRKILLKILEYCRENNIPTVFWNKEDPPNYRTEKYSFAETAKEFDYIFTTAKECIEWYKNDFDHPHVYALPFAGQPKLFNPLNLTGETIDAIIFAGRYTEKYPERARLMVEVLDKIDEQWKDMKIYDRYYFKKGPHFPEKYEKYINPAIDYEETPIVYKQAKWGLNINTVTESETMFARRVFEYSLSNVNILTNYSKGVREIFGDNVFEFDNLEILPDFNGDYEDKRMNNLYNVLENHTYTERWKEILDTIGFEYKEDEEQISIIYKIEDLSKLDEAIENFNKIDYSFKDLQIILSSKCLNDDEELDSIKEKYGEIESIYIENDDAEKELKDNIDSEYWIISNGLIESDFIKKAILHYKYLNKHYAICKGEDKFRLGMEKTVENKVIPRERLDYLDGNENTEVDVYYI